MPASARAGSRRESNLVESVVDPRRPDISPEQLLREVADQRHGEDAVPDGGAEGAVGGPFGMVDGFGIPKQLRYAAMLDPEELLNG